MSLNVVSSAEVMNFSRVNAYLAKINSKLTSKEWVETQVHQKFYKITFDGCMDKSEQNVIRKKMTDAGWTIITLTINTPSCPDGIGSTHLTFM